MDPEDPVSSLQDILSCSICHDMFSNPLTLPCGHSCCQDCIHKHWEMETAKSSFTCPVCRSCWSKRPEPQKNISLSNVVELVGKVEMHRVLVTRVQTDTGTPQIGTTLCQLHHKELTMYCTQDHRCICYQCLMTDCRQHEVQDMEERSRQEMKKLSNDLITSECQQKHTKEEIDKWKCSIANTKDFHEKMVSGLTTKFQQVKKTLDEYESHVLESVNCDRNETLTKAEYHVKQLERHLQDLERHRIEAERLLMSDAVTFLEGVPQLVPVGVTPISPNVQENLQMERVTKILSEVTRLLQKELPDILHPTETSTPPSGFAVNDICDVAGTSKSISDQKTSPFKATEKKRTLRAELWKDYRNLTYDPETANRYIEISHGKTKATHRQSWRSDVPESPKTFHTWQVMSQEGFSEGSHYWEVGISQCLVVELGVAYGSLERINRQENRIGRNSSSWSLEMGGIHHSAWHDNVETKLHSPMFTEIGIHLDLTAGNLTFYGIEDGSLQLLHTFSCLFSEKVFPVFWIGEEASVTICTRANVKIEAARC
ncbi:E3 ubiquitin-protein ligase TRIM65 [Engystomops pustulosus]|uniref:E3 ubiquitin-protein ligase TRIM65 n=1 Tax=Engystomops pustulosus TaxID=76066 RepID=UPI003AFA4DC1